MTENRLRWSVRRGRPDDAAFILHCWERSVGAWLRGAERGSDHHVAQQEIIATLLEKSDVYVACSVNDDRKLHGFVVGERRSKTKPGKVIDYVTLHFAYTRSQSRKQGVARSLVGAMVGPKLMEDVRVSVTEAPVGANSGWVTNYARGKGWAIATRVPSYATITRLLKRKAAA